MVEKQIILGNDHAGVDAKLKVKAYLEKKGYAVVDLGSHNPDAPDDYVDFAQAVGKAVVKSNGKAVGLLLCGTGSGMAIAANKIKGVRAVAAESMYTAKMARVDNNANVLCLRNRFFPYEKQRAIITAYLHANFSKKARHKRRIAKITKLESSKGGSQK